MKTQKTKTKVHHARYSREKLEGMARGSGFTTGEILRLVKKYMPEALKELEISL